MSLYTFLLQLICPKDAASNCTPSIRRHSRTFLLGAVPMLPNHRLRASMIGRPTAGGHRCVHARQLDLALSAQPRSLGILIRAITPDFSHLVGIFQLDSKLHACLMTNCSYPTERCKLPTGTTDLSTLVNLRLIQFSSTFVIAFSDCSIGIGSTASLLSQA
jgi:hypothetical protein